MSEKKKKRVTLVEKESKKAEPYVKQRIYEASPYLGKSDRLLNRAIPLIAIAFIYSFTVAFFRDNTFSKVLRVCRTEFDV